MTFFHSIFFIVVIVSCLTLVLLTLLGRALSNCLPWRLRASARFYLSPVLGLSVLTMVASWIGRVSPFAHTSWLIGSVVVALAVLLWHEPRRLAALQHAALVALFGLLCGVSILTPLWIAGGYDTHNDAYTYLAHAMWLQDHAFSEVIDRASMAPYATQILGYQQESFRMGASYLLAMLQALFQAKWSYDVYPALLIVAMTSCCLSIGMVLARPLRPLARWLRWLILALPACCVGGITYGAYYGFLPQTVGLALGAGLLFLAGQLIQVTTRNRLTLGRLAVTCLPLTFLLSAAVVTYTELAPFLGLSILLASLIMAWRSQAYRKIGWLALCVLLLSGLMLNIELARAYTALRLQIGVVVGTPVDWPLFGFIAHGLGVHGGAWGRLQWSAEPEHTLGVVLLVAMLLILLANAKPIWRQITTGVMLPTALAVLIFFCALLYFRYGVASPFPLGTGQSWSQAKLMDWVFPFSAALILLGLVHWRVQCGRWLTPVLLALFCVGIVSVVNHGSHRIGDFQFGFPGVTHFQGQFLRIRQTIESTCPAHAPVYLAGGPELTAVKFREMLTLYLYDKELSAKWRDDPYMMLLPATRQEPPIPRGACILEPRNQAQVPIAPGITPVGLWQVRLTSNKT